MNTGIAPTVTHFGLHLIKKSLSESNSLCKASALSGAAGACEGKAVKHCCAKHKAAIVTIDDRSRLRIYRGEEPSKAFSYHKSDKKGGGHYYHDGVFGVNEHISVRFFPYVDGTHLALFPSSAHAVAASRACGSLSNLTATDSASFAYCASGWCGDWCPREVFSRLPKIHTCDTCRSRRQKQTRSKRSKADVVEAADTRKRGRTASQKRARKVVEVSPASSLCDPQVASDALSEELSAVEPEAVVSPASADFVEQMPFKTESSLLEEPFWQPLQQQVPMTISSSPWMPDEVVMMPPVLEMSDASSGGDRASSPSLPESPSRLEWESRPMEDLLPPQVSEALDRKEEWNPMMGAYNLAPKSSSMLSGVIKMAQAVSSEIVSQYNSRKGDDRDSQQWLPFLLGPTGVALRYSTLQHDPIPRTRTEKREDPVPAAANAVASRPAASPSRVPNTFTHRFMRMMISRRI